jgi:hypothetical protein
MDDRCYQTQCPVLPVVVAWRLRGSARRSETLPVDVVKPKIWQLMYLFFGGVEVEKFAHFRETIF